MENAFSAQIHGCINTDKVNVREDAGLRKPRIYWATINDRIVILSSKTGDDGAIWYRVHNVTQEGVPGVRDGYVRGDLVDAPIDTPNQKPDSPNWAIRYVNTAPGTTLNLRREPSTEAHILAVWVRGTQCTAHAPASVWTKVKRTTDGQEGYCMSSFLSTYDPCSLGTAETTLRQIAEYSEQNRYNPDFLTVSQYLASLDWYASQMGLRYQPKGYKDGISMCCASLPYLARNKKGYSGCTLQYDNGLFLKGRISILGGFDALVRGMELFQGTDDTKEHMGVYAGKYNFLGGASGNEEHAVYQSTSERPRHSLPSVKYNDPNRQGPNLTSMNDKWLYWGWPKFVRED